MTDRLQNWLESISRRQLVLFYVALVFGACAVVYGVSKIPSGPPWTPPPPATRTVIAEDDWSITYAITVYGEERSLKGDWLPKTTTVTVEK